MAITVKHEVTAKFNSIFRTVNECQKRYRILKGSAGSGKSVNLAQDYILKLSNPIYEGANLVVVRKVDETNRDSTFAELQAAVRSLFGGYADKLWKINLNPLKLECKLTGNQIIFRGMKDINQREKVKSITFKNGKLVWIWVEEATEMLSEDIDILDDRMRGQLSNSNLYYQMSLSFNPVSASHWIKSRYFDLPDPDVFTHHSTYKDNRFIDAQYYKRMERRLLQDPEGYRVYGLGEWGELGGLILTNWEVKEFDHAPGNYDNIVYGQDFGYNHANAILDVGFKDGDIYIGDEMYDFEKATDRIISQANSKNYDKNRLMWCDSANPDKIKMWQEAGYLARAVSKEQGSVLAQIDYLKQCKIYVHPKCSNTIRELGQWKWKKDPKTSLYLDIPVEFFDDAMAALRYSAEDKRRQSKPVTMRINY